MCVHVKTGKSFEVCAFYREHGSIPFCCYEDRSLPEEIAAPSGDILQIKKFKTISLKNVRCFLCFQGESRTL